MSAPEMRQVGQVSRIQRQMTGLLLGVFCFGLTAVSPAGGAGGNYASALLMEAETGQVLFEDFADRPWIPASMVKMMLLLLADEGIDDGRIGLQDWVTASERAQRQGGSQVYLGAGEQAKLYKLLEAVAVGSANDAAVAVAEALYGSVDAAVAAMNERAVDLGMSATRYVNVTGLPERRGKPENLSTARDQATLAREIVLHHPRVLEWTCLTWTRFRKGLVLACTNTLLKQIEGMDGLKTGYHHKARCNIAATAERDGRRLIAIVLGSHSLSGRNREVRRLLENGFRDWQLMEVLAPGDSFGEEFPVAGSWRGTVPIQAETTLRFYVRHEDATRVKIVLDQQMPFEAPIQREERLGEIRAVLDGCTLAAVPALAGRAVARAWLPLPAIRRSPNRRILSASAFTGE